VGLKDEDEVGQSLASCAPGEALTGGGFDLGSEPETADPISPYTLIVDRPGGGRGRSRRRIRLSRPGERRPGEQLDRCAAE
jgi:hypothetical protein